MLTDDPVKLFEHATSAIRFRKQFTDKSKRRIARYATGGYRNDFGEANSTQNYEFEWVTNTVPNWIHQNPRFVVKIGGLPLDDPRLEAMQLGMNAWAEQTNLAAVLRDVAIDVQFDFGVVLVTLEPIADADPGSPIDRDMLAGVLPAVRPRAHRVSPRRFFIDPQATSVRTARILGHICIEDREDLLNAKLPSGKPKYDRELLAAISGDEGVAKLMDELGIPTQGQPQRDQVVFFEMYVPERGMIYTLAAVGGGGAAKFLREPRKYRGPSWGPYTVFGAHTIPDQVMPLAPLAVVEGMINELTAHARQISEDAGAAKRLLITNGDPKVNHAITTAANGSVISIANFDKAIMPIEIAGPLPANLQYSQMLRESADRTIGLTDTVRGNITGATAEEINTAQANRNRRVLMSRSEFQGCVGQVARTVASHMWHNPRVRFPFTYSDPETGKQRSGRFQGGSTEKEAALFDHLQVSIAPMSMEAVDEATLQSRMEKLTNDAFQISQAAVAVPWFRVERWMDDRGEALNVKGAAERYIDMEMLEQARRLANPALYGAAPGMQVGVGVGGGMLPGPTAAPALGPPVPPQSNAQLARRERAGDGV